MTNLEEWAIKFSLAYDILWDLGSDDRWYNYPDTFCKKVTRLANDKPLEYLQKLHACVKRICNS